ncbi:protease Do-like protein 1, chloroplastic [Tanacetum coccineum]|uniref:Protease Do-like protein 1, chloroplastic n=1 Tax=Tanacetum coccineum TaxID=301880 RepID=A0ABQ5F7M8_9ASTR
MNFVWDSSRQKKVVKACGQNEKKNEENKKGVKAEDTSVKKKKKERKVCDLLGQKRDPPEERSIIALPLLQANWWNHSVDVVVLDIDNYFTCIHLGKKYLEPLPSVVEKFKRNPHRQNVFTLDVLEMPQGSGSGFVWDKDGHIVTNYHVIRCASDLRVTLSDQTTYDEKVIGFDQDKDVVVLQIDAPKDN